MVSTASLKPTLASLQKILFPGSCSLCLEPLKPSQQAFCSYCVDNLPFILQACSHCSEPLPLSSQCPACQKKPPNFRHCITLCLYKQPISSAIIQIKKDLHAPETKQLSLLLANHLIATYKDKEMPKIIIPMPAHPLKMASRGFNQSYLIAEFICSKIQGTQLRNDICLRKRLGKAQRFKTRQQRMKILSATFCSYNSQDFKDKSLALVDDVVTTGATAKAATLCLLEAGAKSVDLWCIAKTSWHN